MLRLFFSFPFWVYFIFAIVVGAGTEVLVKQIKTDEAEKAQALTQAPPPAVDLSDYDRNLHRGIADEVVVTGWVNTEHNTKLTKTKKGVVKGTRYMMILAGSGDAEGSRIARAAIIMTEEERELFQELSGQFLSGMLPQGFEFTINGEAKGHVSFSDVAEDAMAEQGVTQAKGFFYLKPFFHGRAAGLAPSEGLPSTARKLGYSVTAGLFVMGLLKLMLRRNRRKVQPQLDPSYQQNPSIGSNPHAAQPSIAGRYGAETPLRRISQRAPIDAAPEPPIQTMKARGVKVPRWLRSDFGIFVVALASLFLLPVNIGIPVFCVGVMYLFAKRLGVIKRNDTASTSGARMPGVSWAAGRSQAAAQKMASDPFDRLQRMDHR